jgi:NADPH:quinone reductase-like Zn-dependent oxidoreductase
VRKVVIERPGGYQRLRLVEQPDPRPAPGEVLIRVAACGVNYADCITRMGLYSAARRYGGYPLTPGFEVSGRVAEVGEGVGDLSIGTEVVAITRFGGYTSHLVVPRQHVLQIPAGVPLEQAAGFPTVFLTAWFALFELAHPRPGARLLVHSAAGGVGSALVQLGRLAGARVIGVVGAEHKIVPVLGLGAEAVIDKSRQELWREAERLSPEGYDVVLDANGVSTLMQSYRHLAPAGKLVVYGFASMLPHNGRRPSRLRLLWDYWRTPRFDPLRMSNRNRSVLAFNLSFLFDRSGLFEDAMGNLLGWLAEGRIRLPQVTVYPLEEAAVAQRALESGQTVGKLILSVRE